MECRTCEDFDSGDFFRTMTGPNLSHEPIKMLAQLLGLGEYMPEFAPMTAEKMLFIHSNVDYTFTAKELSWLTSTSEMLKGRTEAGINIFVFKMSCSPDDYYIPSAALIKIFNIAFSEDNLFVFKVGKRFSIGCRRTFFSNPPNNFCITSLFGEDTPGYMDELMEELFYAAAITNYPSVLMAFSPQENAFQRSFDQSRFDIDYLLFLDEIQSMYGVDTSLEKERYIVSFSDEHDQGVSYRTACNVLHDIAVGEKMSSLEFLDAAISAEETVPRQKTVPADSDDESAGNALLEFSEEAYQNAEVMLTEMLGHRSKRQGNSV